MALRMPPRPPLIRLTVAQSKPRLLDRLALGQPDEPVRHRDDSRHPLKVAAFLRVLNRVLEHASFLVKLKHEEAAELRLVIFNVASEEFSDLVDLIVLATDTLVETANATTFRLAACAPADDKFLIPKSRVSATVFDHSLREYHQSDVA